MEQISVFDILKIGVGPSSSHTMGPWRAAQRFVENLFAEFNSAEIKKLRVDLFGSLAKTGKGHGTDIAVLLGLSGADPVTIQVESITHRIEQIRSEKKLFIKEIQEVPFDPKTDIVFHFNRSLPYHPNAIQFTATLKNGASVEEIYYSIGGGFILKEGEQVGVSSVNDIKLKFPIETGDDLLEYCSKNDLSISQVVLENEKSWRSKAETEKGILNIYTVMKECIFRGAHTDGFLPGNLNVKRRASSLSKAMLPELSYINSDEWFNSIKNNPSNFNEIIKWVSCFALAVNEENASFGRVVTAPTNGAAGVIPAVLMYFLCFSPNKGDEDIIKFLATASEIGSILKKGSTISAAMGGCQAEIGVSSAMAAGALTEVMGGTPQMVFMAAEIAMEHHLGLTCDPIGGLVQIPCIERNTMGAIKAITASQLALSGDPSNAKVSLDGVIKTMWETAKDMNEKYKETSDGGLAVNISVNLPEC